MKNWPNCPECGGAGWSKLQLPCPDKIDSCAVFHYTRKHCELQPGPREMLTVPAPDLLELSARRQHEKAVVKQLSGTTRVHHMTKIVELETENRLLKKQLEDAEDRMREARGRLHHMDTALIDGYFGRWCPERKDK